MTELVEPLKHNTQIVVLSTLPKQVHLVLQVFLKWGGVISKQGKKLEKVTDICSTLLARDYKGFGNQGMTGVIEYEV